MSTQKGKLSGWDKAIADGRTKLVEGKVYLRGYELLSKCLNEKKPLGSPGPRRAMECGFR
jgi:hypothetical protein